MVENISKETNIDLLMQGRQLVHTSYEVTAIQNRIFYYCLLNAQKEKNGELCCDVKLEELKKLIPNKNQRTLNNIKKTFQILRNTTIEFEKNEEGDKIECDYNLIAASEYNRNKEIFKIFFMDRLYKHIIDYTIYAPLNLDIITKFKSFYSQRLYELLRLWSRHENIIVKSFKIEQLKFILGVENKYPEYKNFKQRVLNQAIKEINIIGNMDVSIEEIKNGRKIEEIKFTILDYERKVYFKNKQYNIVNEKQKEKVENYKENNTVIMQDFYIPNKKLFTSKTLVDFINDFNKYDFKDSKIKNLFYEAIGTTLEKDDEEKIKAKSYNYFKKTLENKIATFLPKQIETEDKVFKKTKFHNFDETYTNYSQEELDDIILKSQEKKYRDR